MTQDSYRDEPQQKLRLFFYLIPVLGVFPAAWALYQGVSGQERSVSRLAVTLGLGWIVATVLLGAGAELSSAASLRFLIASSFVGSGYFLVNIGLMVRVWRQQSVRLPGVTQLSRRLP
ncbi:hypothetical protein IQ241_08300 [Romeria aff. gracilis LEGE 07310]|uniref:Uncharacterized protein n=1 Tax=Vasconcelosia minhoensis LEGE 07310 TaxID=915328 RepID=A0A8J7ALP6_9CYAN|nr:hypothetical protein [Romeria gracilis]MBE9077295.1 hypothetical protein [Romeria aff. gracilis LEGE 07310]